jgi:hypothetical protein
MGESSAELVAPATDRFVCDHDTTLEQQFLNVAKAQAEPEMPVNRAADDGGREAVTVIKRFRFLHHFILPPPPRQADRAVESLVNVWCRTCHRSCAVRRTKQESMIGLGSLVGCAQPTGHFTFYSKGPSPPTIICSAKIRCHVRLGVERSCRSGIASILFWNVCQGPAIDQ